MRLGSYSWALVRLGVLPVTHGDARNHGRSYGILMESPNSVADLGRDLNPSLFVGVGCRFRCHLVISVVGAALDVALRPAWLGGLPVKSAIRHTSAISPPTIKAIFQAPRLAQGGFLHGGSSRAWCEQVEC